MERRKSRFEEKEKWRGGKVGLWRRKGGEKEKYGCGEGREESKKSMFEEKEGGGRELAG